VIAGPRLWARVWSEVRSHAGASVSKRKIASPIIGWQHFAGFDAPIRCVGREIGLKIRLRRRELLREFRILPTSVAQRPREIRKDEPLEIGVILAVVEKPRSRHARLVARDARSLVLDSSDAPEHWKRTTIKSKNDPT
jgi:hypothetical protein